MGKNGQLNFKAEEATVSTVELLLGDATLRLKNRVTIPPYSETTVTAVVENLCGVPSVCLTEPGDWLTDKSDVMLAHAIVCPTEAGVPIRLLNGSGECVSLEKATRVGQLQPILAVTDVMDEEPMAVGNTSADSAGELLSVLQIGSREPAGLWQIGGSDEAGGERISMGVAAGLPQLSGRSRTVRCTDDGWDLTPQIRGAGTLRDDEERDLRALVTRYSDVFAMTSDEIGRTTVQHHSIETKGKGPIFQPARRLPWAARESTRQLVDEMKQQGVVEDSTSPWSSPIVLVKKKDGSTRFCVDYRKLNAVTEKDPYPLPRIDDTLDALGGAKYFSTLDLCSGYHQLPMADVDKEKTAFSTPDGHYQFTVMPFGVCNGPSSFQRLMAVVLRGLQWRTCLVYLDDIIVFGRTFKEHLDRLEEVFLRLREAGLKLKPSKCHLLRDQVEFLGHVVSADGVSTDSAKTNRVAKWTRPTSVGEVRTFLGFCGYYRRFVRNYSTVAKPLTELTRQNHAFVWSAACEAAFDALKHQLTSAPTLAYPNFGKDASAFILDVDASGTGLGAVLSQADDNGIERPIAYASRLKSSTERRYPSTKSELLGVVWAFGHFRCYLLGKRFLVRTDHKALQHLGNFKEPSAIVARWLEFLSQFEYDVQYRAGRSHANADALSRQPANDTPSGVMETNTCVEFKTTVLEETPESTTSSSVATVALEECSVADAIASAPVATDTLEQTSRNPVVGNAEDPSKGPTRGGADKSASSEREGMVEVSVATVTDANQGIPAPFVQRMNMTMADWATAQRTDTDLKRLLEWLNPASDKSIDLTGISPALRKYWRGRQSLAVREGVVGRLWHNADGITPPIFQILVPVELRVRILEEYHDFLGHVGMKRMYVQLRARFHWYQMKRDVGDWVGSCESCSRRSRPVGRGLGAPLQPSWAGYPFERIAMDLIPGLPETSNGNRHLLVVVDYFTKWVEAYPLKNMEAMTIASVFVSEFVSRFGAPDNLHTDQGRNFESKLFRGVCNLLGIRKTRTTPYHPASDGLVERFNQTLERLLSHYVAEHQRDWDIHLPAVLMAYRATVQESTGYTPAYLLFGREFCLPQDVAYGIPSGPSATVEESTYVRDLRQRMTSLHTIVRQKLGLVHQYQAHLYDSKAVPVTFAVGERAWLLVPAIPTGTSPKLAKLWKGPFTIVERISDLVYRIRDTASTEAKLQVVHINRLKKCIDRPSHLLASVNPPGDAPSRPTGQDMDAMPQPPSRTRGCEYIPDATDWLYMEDDDRRERFDLGDLGTFQAVVFNPATTTQQPADAEATEFTRAEPPTTTVAEAPPSPVSRPPVVTPAPQRRRPTRTRRRPVRYTDWV